MRLVPSSINPTTEAYGKNVAALLCVAVASSSVTLENREELFRIVSNQKGGFKTELFIIVSHLENRISIRSLFSFKWDGSPPFEAQSRGSSRQQNWTCGKARPPIHASLEERQACRKAGVPEAPPKPFISGPCGHSRRSFSRRWSSTKKTTKGAGQRLGP